MDPIAEHYLHNRLKQKTMENYRKSLDYYDNDVLEQYYREEESELGDFTSGGYSLSGNSGTDIQLLEIVPPFYQLIPEMLLSGGINDTSKKIIRMSKKFHRNPYKDLYGVIGRGVLMGAMYDNELYGGSFLSGIKSLTKKIVGDKTYKKIEKDTKKSLNALKQGIENPLDFTENIASYIGEILPQAIETGTKIATDPQGTVGHLEKFVNNIWDTADKYSKEWEQTMKGKGGCCSLCMGKRKGGCCAFCRGGISESIMTDPEFRNKLAARRELIDNAETIKEGLMEEYNMYEEEGDEIGVEIVEEEIEVIDKLIDNLYEQEDLQYNISEENITGKDAYKDIADMNKELREDIKDVKLVLNDMLKNSANMPKIERNKLVKDIEIINANERALDSLNPEIPEAQQFIPSYEYRKPYEINKKVHEEYGEMMGDVVMDEEEEQVENYYSNYYGADYIQEDMDVMNYLNAHMYNTGHWKVGDPEPNYQRIRKGAYDAADIYRNSTYFVYPEDMSINGNATASLPLLRDIDCPDLDPSVKLVAKYIDFVYPQLPNYIRATLTKNLYKSLKIV